MADSSLPWYSQAGDWLGEATGAKTDFVAMRDAEQARLDAEAKYGQPILMDTTQSDKDLAQQRELADMMFGAARGTVPSAAELMLQRSMDENAASMNSMASSGRGGVSPALLQKMAMDAGAEANQRGAAEMAIVRAREQADARQALSGHLGGMRGQNINIAGANLNAGVDAKHLGYEAGRDTYNQRVAAANADADRRAAMVDRLIGVGTTFATGQQAPKDNSGPTYDYRPGGGVGGTGAKYNYGGAQDPTDVIAWADGGISAEPTVKLIAEAGPEAVVPLTSPEDAALAAHMIQKARAAKQGGDMGDLAVRMTGGAAPVIPAAVDPRMADLALLMSGGGAPARRAPGAPVDPREAIKQRARDYAARMGNLAVMMTGGR